MQTITSALELLGAALIVVGFFLFWPPVGFVAAGVACLYFGWLLAPPPPRGDPR